MRVREQQDSQQVIAMQSYSGEGFYERLGVRPVINAWSWVTVAGGSIMPAPVLRAMEEASRNFVDLPELNRKAGEVIARLTGAEAGLVTAGSGAGMLLQAAACMTGADPARVWRLPDTRGMKNRIVIHRSHRVTYDRNFRTAGAKLVEIGDTGVTEPWQLEDAITRRTAAVAYVFGPRKSGALSLETVVEIAHSRGVPVIVDAAAMLPPAENLTKFIRVGADMVSFSGGKGVMGPQSSGILCGRKDLIEAASMNAAPNSQGIGRPAKVSKENIAGLVTALELFVDTDHQAVEASWRGKCEYVVDALQGIDGVRAELAEARPELEDSRSGHAKAVISLEAGRPGPSEAEVIEQLREGDPSILLGPAGPEGGIAVVPVNLRNGEEEIVARRLREVLTAS